MSGPGCKGLSLGFLFLLSFPLSSARCIHDSVQSRVRVLHNRAPDQLPLQPPLRRLQALSQDPLLPIRIRAWYLPAESAPLSGQQATQLLAAVGEATHRISQALAVRPVPGRLLLSRDRNQYCRSVWRNPASPNFNKCGSAESMYRTESCLEVTIPDDHLEGYAIWPEYGDAPREAMRVDGDGVSGADFILYVKVASTEKCHSKPSVIAYASYCQLDHTGRPLAGAIVFCPTHLMDAAFRHADMVQVTLHELLHALGFSRSLFEKWKDCTYAPAIGVNCSSRARVTNTDEAGQLRIFTPAVMQKMREHLGGGDVGAPLENQDMPGLPSSHWEARVLQGSIMAASLPEPRLTQLDEVTLAAFADMGWYQVNASAGRKLVWGRGAGPAFGLTSTCTDGSSKYFCTGSGSGCHYLHLHKGRCSTDAFLDGCRMYKPLANGSECWVEGNGAAVAPGNRFGEIYRLDSRCFFSTLAKEGALSPGSPPKAEPVAGCCYRHRCVAEDTYEVKVTGSPWLNCPEGTSIEVPGYRGHLFCPVGLFCQNFVRSGNPPPGEGVTGSAPYKTDSVSNRGQTTIERTRAFILQGVLETQRPSLGLAEREQSQLATLLVHALANSSGVTGCHFGNLTLDPGLSFKVEFWHSLACPDSPVGMLAHRLQSTFQNTQITFNFNGKDFTVVLVRLLDAALPPPSVPPAAEGHLTALLTCLGLTMALLLAAGTIAHRKHRAVAQVGVASWAP